MTINPRVIDISHHNQDDKPPIDFDAIKRDGIWGVICKATEDTDYTDPFFNTFVQEAKRAGLLVGAYHFFRPGNIIDQAQHFLRTVQPPRDMLLVLDHEDTGCSLDDVKEWMRYVETETGQRPALYSGHVLKDQIGSGKDSYLAGSRLWIAQYGDNAEVPPNWDEPWLWQFTDGNVGPEPHSIDGVGHCDINSTEARTQDELAETWGRRRVRPPRPRPPPETAVPMPLMVMRAITGLDEASGEEADNPKILAMADYIARKYPEMESYCAQYQHDSTPWCGLCSAFCCAVANIRPPFGPTDTDKFLWALAWSDLKDARGFKLLDEPKTGAIIVTTRDGGGHVTMFEQYEFENPQGRWMCRGGNQSDCVNVTAIDPDTVVAIMWPPEKDLNVPDVPGIATDLDSFNAWVQSSLNLLGVAQPHLDVDGEYGPLTTDAVKAFQRDNSMPQTGIADQVTVDVMIEALEETNDTGAGLRSDKS